MAIRGNVKGRSETTYQNKLRRMKKFYSKTFRNSKKSKELAEKRGESKFGQYFCDKYPTEQSFLKVLNLKESNAKGER